MWLTGRHKRIKNIVEIIGCIRQGAGDVQADFLEVYLVDRHPVIKQAKHIQIDIKTLSHQECVTLWSLEKHVVQFQIIGDFIADSPNPKGRFKFFGEVIVHLACHKSLANGGGGNNGDEAKHKQYNG